MPLTSITPSLTCQLKTSQLISNVLNESKDLQNAHFSHSCFNQNKTFSFLILQTYFRPEIPFNLRNQIAKMADFQFLLAATTRPTHNLHPRKNQIY